MTDSQSSCDSPGPDEVGSDDSTSEEFEGTDRLVKMIEKSSKMQTMAATWDSVVPMHRRTRQIKIEIEDLLVQLTMHMTEAQSIFDGLPTTTTITTTEIEELEKRLYDIQTAFMELNDIMRPWMPYVIVPEGSHKVSYMPTRADQQPVRAPSPSPSASSSSSVDPQPVRTSSPSASSSSVDHQPVRTSSPSSASSSSAKRSRNC